MAIVTLTADQARLRCDPASFLFETTADLPYSDDIIGQPRGARAIDFGVNMAAPGYNLFVMGPTGTGRTTAVKRYLERTAPTAANPSDWAYVHNFAEPRKPIALRTNPGQAVKLREAMDGLIAQVQQKLPRAFETEAYEDATNIIQTRLQQKQSEALQAVQDQAAPDGFNLVRTAAGLAIAPEPSDKTLNAEQLFKQATLNDALEDALRAIREMEKAAREALRDLDAQVAQSVIKPLVADLAARMDDLAAEKDRAAIEGYLTSAQQDLIGNVALFKPAERGGAETDPTAMRMFLNRYRVNVLVDNCEACGAPIVTEDYPTYYNLIGRLDRALTISTNPAAANFVDHMMLRPGALIRANGGFLIIRARDIFLEPDAWFALKRSLLKSSVTIEEPNAHTQLITAPTLEPQPIPLNVKVIMLGGSEYWAANRDDDFRALFKVRAEFSTDMDRTPANEQAYALFLRNRGEEEGLMPFDRAGVAAMVEHGSRMAADQKKLATKFREVADIAREAAFWAARAGRTAVSAEDVRVALEEKRNRLNRYEEDWREWMLRGGYYVQTSGTAVGQVNGLSVIDNGEYEFARPSRITARSYVMRGGISDIDRSVSFTDATHNKGIAIIDSYLSGLYSVEQPLTVSANVVFEQSYGSHEGDSASCALLVAMLSAVTGLPIPQYYGITGTLDQFGAVRPIGATNTKIEGFFDMCLARGLDGTQGVIIPQANAADLMLRQDVVDAIREGKFHLYTVEHIEDLIELMFGMKAGARGEDGKFPEDTVHAKVEAALKENNEKLDGRRKKKGNKDEQDDEDDDKKEPDEPEPPPEPGPEPAPEPPVPPEPPAPPEPEPEPPEPPAAPPQPEPEPPPPPSPPVQGE
jgi:predicted ATP-dependent protease